MFVRVVRFTGVTAERVEALLARMAEEDGPPPGVPIKGLQMLFDASQGTAVVLQLFDSAEDMSEGEWEPRHHTALFDPNDPDWRLVQAKFSGYSDTTIESVRLIIERIACDTRGVLAYDKDGVPVAAALAGVANGIGIFWYDLLPGRLPHMTWRVAACPFALMVIGPVYFAD